jgi:RNA polymerase sigma-B factor
MPTTTMDEPAPASFGMSQNPSPGMDEQLADERMLLERYARDQSPTVREELVDRFMPLARRLAARYAGGAEPFDDLVQVASVGLVKAIDRFDPARGTAFSTFAVPTILGELKRHFRDRGWSVRVPRDLQEMAGRVDRVTETMTRSLGRAPSPAEIAGELGTTTERVLEAREAAGAYRAISLDRPRDDEEPGAEVVAETVGVEDPGFRLAEAAATVERLMLVLTDREREVLRLRFVEDLTQTEIGARVGVSQMHVSRLIRQALARLRDAAEDERDVA